MIDTPTQPKPAPQERLEIDIAGRIWIIEREGDLEALWTSLDDLDDDERLPYWVELWPSSLLLARWLEDNSDVVAGRTLADLGCGLGLTAMVAASLGGKVLGLDYQPEAVKFARRNALLNASKLGNSPLQFIRMDWRNPAIKPGSLDLVLAADVLYELRFVDQVLDFLEYALKPGGWAVLADPQRSTWPRFQERSKNRGFGCRLLCRQTVTAATMPQTTCLAGIYGVTIPKKQSMPLR